MPRPERVSLREAAFAGLFFLALLLVAHGPDLVLGREFIADIPGDPQLVLTILDWTASRLNEGFAGVWDAPWFFPMPGALALADHLLGLAPLYALGRGLGFEPVMVYHLLVYGSFPLVALTLYLVLRGRGAGRFAGLTVASAYAFSPYRLSQVSHLQVLWSPFLPLAAWTFDRLLARPTSGRALLFLASYAGAVTGGSYLAYWVHLPLLCIAAMRLLRFRRRLRGRRLAIVVASGACAAALAAATFLPYVEKSRELDRRRTAEQFSRFGATASSWLARDARNVGGRMLGKEPQRNENVLFPGFLLVAAALVGGYYAFQGRARAGAFERSLALAGVMAFLLAHPLFYTLAARVVPGMNGMRVPSRVAPICFLALALLAAPGLEVVRRRLGSRWRPWLPAACLALVLVDAVAVPRPADAFRGLPRTSELTPAWRAIDVPVVVLPIREPYEETSAIWLGRLAGARVANGFGGYAPRDWRKLRRRCGYPVNAIDGPCLDQAASSGVGLLLIRDGPDRAPGVAPLPSRLAGAIRPEIADRVVLVRGDAEHLLLAIRP